MKEKKEFEPIFIGEDTAQRAEVMGNLNFQIRKMQDFLPLLKEANILPTYEVVMDCLTIQKEQRNDNGTPVYVFKNCEHIDREFAKQIDLMTEGKPKVIAEGFKEEIERTANTLKEGVFKVFANLGSISKESTAEARKYFIVEEGKITLPEDIEERVKRDTGVWCKTEAQAQAYEAHKQAAEALNGFLSYFPKSVLSSTPSEVGLLFRFGENGSIMPQTIDYSLYIH